VLPVALDLSPLILLMCIVRGHSNQRQSTPQSLESDYSDGAMPLYSIYSNIAEDEDSKMVERCRNDSDGTLIFVSPHVNPQMTPNIN
jgi:hypothetical protein